MAADESSAPLGPDGATPSERTASKVGAMVAEQVRRAIESAELSAQELHRRALDHASGHHDEVNLMAMLVLTRIDAVEAQVARLLDGVRDEVARIAEEAVRAEIAAPPQDPPSPVERSRVIELTPEAVQMEPAVDAAAEARSNATVVHPASQGDGPTSDIDSQVSPSRPARQRRGGLFRRRPPAPPRCDVCGRVAQAGDAALERWLQVARMSLCPECQAEGWQLPSGGTVPYRATRQRDPG